MSISRRVVLSSALGVATVGSVAAFADMPYDSGNAYDSGNPYDSGSSVNLGVSPIIAENGNVGSDNWQIGREQTQAAHDRALQIKGYASATSVNVGESINFHVTVEAIEEYKIDIYRRGFYSGAGSRLMTTSPVLAGIKQADPAIDPETGMVTCDWAPSWSLPVGNDWISGVYFAVFTTASGWRSYAPFVVREDARKADLCVVLPFSTYQAYNMWPKDGERGKSLYYGYEGLEALLHEKRAHKVSFDRPYTDNDGLGNGFDLDGWFAEWVESRGYDVAYISSMDLHTGVDLSKYAGVIFSGHDEYWSKEMRKRAHDAVTQGTSLAFMSANNLYWHVRFEPAPDGRPSRVLVCYKSAEDPQHQDGGATSRWRAKSPGPENPEQSLLGVMYNGMLADPVPLVVQEADHWFWAGTGVSNGDLIDNAVGGEADGIVPEAALPSGVRQTILSASPYVYKGTGEPRVQNTSLYETEKGAIVFAAASLTWPQSLASPRYADTRIQTATANLLDRIVKLS